MKKDLLNVQGRSERLRDIVERISKGEKLSAFRLAVDYDVSINVVYRDVKALKGGDYIKKEWEFSPKEETLPAGVLNGQV